MDTNQVVTIFGVGIPMVVAMYAAAIVGGIWAICAVGVAVVGYVDRPPTDKEIALRDMTGRGRGRS